MIIYHLFPRALHLKFNCYNIIDVLHRPGCNCEIMYYPLSATSKFVFSGGQFFVKNAAELHFKLSISLQ